MTRRFESHHIFFMIRNSKYDFKVKFTHTHTHTHTHNAQFHKMKGPKTEDTFINSYRHPQTHTFTKVRVGMRVGGMSQTHGHTHTHTHTHTCIRIDHRWIHVLTVYCTHTGVRQRDSCGRGQVNSEQVLWVTDTMK